MSTLAETRPSELHSDSGTILSINSLSLSHFRNYGTARLELNHKPIVVLTGRNGAGKTNILEALSLLTPGRGLRKARISEIDSTKSEGMPWAVASTATGMQGNVQIGTGRDPEGSAEQNERRIIRMDGKTSRSQAELGRHLAMLWLTPQMEQLFQEGATAARKFLDRLVYSFDPEHASRVNEYEYAMRERNRILQNGYPDPHWLDALEQTMAETGCAIASARLQTLESINHAMSLSTLSFPKAGVGVDGMAENLLKEGIPAIGVEESLKRTWREARRPDATAGRTLSGVHRSEMRVLHLEKRMPAGQCSTGEQKALLISIVLSQARAGAMWKGVVPVLLFDEIAAHLDATRRLELFGEICQIGAQTWMTGQDPLLFTEVQGNAQYFQVDDGRILS